MRLRRNGVGVGLAPADVARGLRRAVGLPERDGLLIRGVEEGGPADAAGLKEGDLLVKAGDKEITDFDALMDVLEGAGSELKVTVVRGVDEQTIRVSLN